MTPEYEALREAVARALLNRTCAHYGDPVPENPDLSLTTLLADAALAVVREALREPSHEMQWAGSAHTVGNISLFLKVWNAAFAASALGGPGHE